MEFWARQEVATRKNGYQIPQFRATRGTTQGGLTSTTLFNVAVDNMVRHWLSMTVEDDVVIFKGLVHAVGRSMGVLYADNGLLGSRGLEWLQGDPNVRFGLFRQIGLMANIAKSKTMMCQQGMIRSGILEEVVGWRSMGKEVPTCRGYSVGFHARTAGGVDVRVNDGPQYAPAWNRTANLLEPATSQSSGAPTPGV